MYFVFIKKRNMLKRTPLIALVLAGILSIIIILIFEIPSRPFTIKDAVVLYFLSLFISLGIALLFDPIARETTQKLSKINFYEDK